MIIITLKNTALLRRTVCLMSLLDESSQVLHRLGLGSTAQVSFERSAPMFHHLYPRDVNAIESTGDTLNLEALKFCAF